MEPFPGRRREYPSARVLGAAGLALLLGGMLAVILDARGTGDDLGAQATTTPARAATTRRSPPPPAPPSLDVVRLAPVAAYDPEGDGVENDELAGAAVDRDVTTSWRTERYSNFFKDGVGLVLDARRPRRLVRVVVSTDTPGFTAVIRVAGAPEGPYRTVSAQRTVVRRAPFPLRRARARYVLVWITDLPDDSAAGITEVRALARGA